MVQLVEIICAIVALCGGMTLPAFAWTVIICELIRTFCEVIIKLLDKE